MTAQLKQLLHDIDPSMNEVMSDIDKSIVSSLHNFFWWQEEETVTVANHNVFHMEACCLI